MPAVIRRRVVVAAPDTIHIVDDSIPSLKAGEAIVRMVLAGVCGSDKAGVRGVHAFFEPPYHPGHEVLGVVEDVASGAAGVRPGDRVVVEPTLPCGDCKNCRRLRENLCQNLDFFGCGSPEGGMTDRFVIRVDRLHLVPDTISDLAAVLVEPLATACHAVRLAGDLAGQTVAIIGTGTIGLLVLALVRTKSPHRLVVVDPVQHKRDLAVRLGADVALDADGDIAARARRALGESADVVFDCVAAESTIGSAVEMAIKGGTVVVVGGARSPVTIELPRIQEYEVRLQGSITYTRLDFEQAISLMASGLVGTEDFVTAVYPFHDAAQAFRPESFEGQVKVLVAGDAIPAADASASAESPS